LAFQGKGVRVQAILTGAAFTLESKIARPMPMSGQSLPSPAFPPTLPQFPAARDSKGLPVAHEGLSL